MIHFIGTSGCFELMFPEGINFESKKKVILFSIPSQSQFYISFNAQEAVMFIYNLQGHVVLGKSIEYNEPVDINTLNDGIYHLALIINDNLYRKRLVVFKRHGADFN